MTRTPTIFIVDDDDAIRDSLRLLLESVGLTRIVAYGSGRSFLDNASPQPGDCLVLDVCMPDIDGLELQAELSRRDVSLPIIVMTAHGDVPIAVRAMKAGAVDFIEKPFSDDVLIESVRRALVMAASFDRESVERAAVRERLERLTVREREVFEGLVAGRPNKVIAHDLGISPRTVEIHRARVMDKMEARSLSALVRMAMATGTGGS
jgi:two-component system, LuxR family, response regulator FixJ